MNRNCQIIIINKHRIWHLLRMSIISFRYFFPKREICFEISSFGGSLFSGDRYFRDLITPVTFYRCFRRSLLSELYGNISCRGGSRILHEWFAPTKLGGFGMLPQENLKFSALKVPFSCVLRAPQAIQTHKQYLLQKGIILYKYSLLCLTIQGNIFLSRCELCLSVSKGSSKWISI